MHSFVSFRLTSHVCLYSALLCLFNVFQTSWQCFALLIALSLLACFLAVNCRLPALRLLCGLLPLLALLVPARFCFADVIFSPTELILIALNDLWPLFLIVVAAIILVVILVCVRKKKNGRKNRGNDGKGGFEV